MTKSVLLLHIPALHQGYLELFKRVSDKVDELWIVGSDIIADFPELAREVRAVQPETIQKVLAGLQVFPVVKIVTKKDLPQLSGRPVILANELISDQLREAYFPNSPTETEMVFLRWDTKNVQASGQISPDLKISRTKFDREVIGLTEEEAQKSSDWYRQVGAAAVKNKKVVLLAHNTRQPTAEAAYIEGDPRNFIEYGTRPEMKSTIHAEQLVISEAAKRGITLKGTDLYVSVFPCPDCANLIANTQFSRLYFGSGYTFLDGEKVLKDHGVQIIKVE